MQNYLIQKYSGENTDKILALFRLAFNKEATPEWFRWKYLHSPWGSRGYMALDAKRVVAFYGGIRLQFIFQGKLLWAYQFCDVMTDPEYRARLISKTPFIVKLGEIFYRENPMDFAFGFPSLRHARLQSLRLGGEGNRFIQLYEKGRLKKHPVFWKLKVDEGWELLDGKELHNFSAHSRRDILRFEKDEDYIRWRYINNPSNKYGLLVFKRLNRIRGYAVYKTEEESFHILEVFSRNPGDVRDMLISLEWFIINTMKHIRTIKAWFHPGETLKDSLDNLGYIGKDSIPIAFKSVNADCGVNAEIFYDRFFYRMGDYDAS
ncbi:MAG: GNAT family N-acetyltransferase [Nitrospira sp.]|nr:GNAT family N-acetyltransferase [Nitrospira sp.]